MKQITVCVLFAAATLFNAGVEGAQEQVHMEMASDDEMSLRGRVMENLAKSKNNNKKKPKDVSCGDSYTVDFSTGGYIVPSIPGEYRCTEIGSLTVTGCSKESCTLPTQLSTATKIIKDLNVQYNSGITSLSFLPAVATIGGSLNVLCNNALLGLSGLGSLTSAGAVTISQDPVLTSLDGIAQNAKVGTLNLVRLNAVTSWGSMGSVKSLTGFYLDLATSNSFPSISTLMGNQVSWAQVYRSTASDTQSVLTSICTKPVRSTNGGYDCGQKGSGWNAKTPLVCSA